MEAVDPKQLRLDLAIEKNLGVRWTTTNDF